MKKTLMNAARKVAGPLLVSVAIFIFFYFGGDAYQTFGLAAVDSTRRALKYVLGVAAFLSAAVLAQRIIQYVVFDGLIATATGAPVPKLLSQISGLVIFVVAISACAGIVFEQDLTVLWAASGVAGLVLGMALKELLQDVFAGIALNIDRAIRIGEFVQIHRAGDSKISGQVQEISWRTTRVKDFMGDVVIFPNSKFSAFTITNYSQPEPVSYRWANVTLDSRVPLHRAMRILQAAALEAMTRLVGPDTAPPWVEVRAIKLEGVEYAIYYKAEWRYLANATTTILQSVLVHLAQAGLEPACARSEHLVVSAEAAASGGAATGAAAAAQLPGPEQLVGLLASTPLFDGVDTMALRKVAAVARLRELPEDRIVVQSGEAGTALYLVLEGLLTAEEAKRIAGRPPKPTLLRPGELFDPAVALLGEAHGATVRSRTPVLLCEMDHDALQRLFAGDPGALSTVSANLARFYRTKNGAAATGDEDDPHAELQRQLRYMFPIAWASEAE